MAYIRGYHDADMTRWVFGKDGWRFGWETEVEAPEDAYREDMERVATVVEGMLPAHIVVFEHDGSLDNGFEMVTRPMTRAYFTAHVDQFRAAYDYLMEQGYRAHDTTTCGLHVHIGRGAFGEVKAEQDANVCKVLLLVERFWGDFGRIARRDGSNYARRLFTDTPMKAADKVSDRYDQDHFDAVNLCNHDTVEFRMFKGSLKWDTVQATIEFLFALVQGVEGLPVRRAYEVRTLRAVIARYLLHKAQAAKGKTDGAGCKVLETYLNHVGVL